MKIEVEKYEKDKKTLSLDTLLEILGNPTRRVILAKLAKVPHSTSELANELGISRQAVHSQLEILTEKEIIEKIESDEKRGGTYRIKSDISLSIDISPDYYGVKYNVSEIGEKSKIIQLKDIGCSTDYKKIKQPNEKIRFLGEKIQEIEESIRNLERERTDLLQNKQCFIAELKSIMEEKYRNKLRETIEKRQFKAKNIRESLNLIEEIFYTLFFNPNKYYKRIDIDNLLDDMFFSDMDSIERAQNRISIEPLLKDLSKLMDFFKEDDDFWFFDF
ncbi:MAG: ArsR/SmtB family transcription factor [Promethearchaeota archaeon]